MDEKHFAVLFVCWVWQIQKLKLSWVPTVGQSNRLTCEAANHHYCTIPSGNFPPTSTKATITLFPVRFPASHALYQGTWLPCSPPSSCSPGQKPRWRTCWSAGSCRTWSRPPPPLTTQTSCHSLSWDFFFSKLNLGSSQMSPSKKTVKAELFINAWFSLFSL